MINERAFALFLKNGLQIFYNVLSTYIYDLLISVVMYILKSSWEIMDSHIFKREIPEYTLFLRVSLMFQAMLITTIVT